MLGAMAAQAAPAEGSLGGFNPSVQNRVKQTFVNPVATYPFLVKPWKARWEMGFHEGDLMFIFKGNNIKNTSSKMVVLANLPTLNHIMADATDIEAVYKEKLDWAYIGVMRNSAVASNQIGGGMHRASQARGGNQRPAERIINIDVRGSTRMFNYWENAMPGQKLHLVWRKVYMGSKRLGNPNDSKHAAMMGAEDGQWSLIRDGAVLMVRYHNKHGRKIGNDLNRTDYEAGPGAGDRRIFPHGASPFSQTWQLLPYSGFDDDYIDDPIWWNPQIIPSRQMHCPITVGFVFQGIGAGERSDVGISIRKATQLAEDRFKLPMVHCFVRV